MLKLDKYLQDNFFNSFLTLFSILFIIASMVLMLAISNMTAMLKITLSEFLYLYILSLPEIIFYTLPLTFFVTAALSISKLFENSELIMVLSLGTSPKQITKPFFKLSLLTTIFLLFITFFSIPTTQILYKNFFNTKKIESQFNFQPSSIGQKFGEWNIFIKDKKHNNYENIVMYNNNQQILITAKSSKTYKKNNYFVLYLSDGNLYNKTKEQTTKLNFKHLQLNQKIELTSLNLYSIKDYIKKYPKKINKYLLISFFPIIGFLFLASISFFHNRYQANHSIIYSMIIAVSYYGIVFTTYKNLNTIFFIIPIFFIIAKIIEKQRIKQF